MTPKEQKDKERTNEIISTVTCVICVIAVIVIKNIL